MQRSAQRLHPPPRHEIRRVAEFLDTGHHRFAIEHTGDIMGDSGGHLLEPRWRQFAEEQRREPAPDVRKRVPIEEQEWRAPVKCAQLVQRLA